jgi:hypothetical protein
MLIIDAAHMVGSGQQQRLLERNKGTADHAGYTAAAGSVNKEKKR